MNYFPLNNHRSKSYIICFALLLFLVSCNTGNKVVSTLGKRKYTKGYYSFLPAKRKEYKFEKFHPIAITPLMGLLEQYKNLKTLNKEDITLLKNLIEYKPRSIKRNLVHSITTVTPYSEPTIRLCNLNKYIPSNMLGEGRHEQSKPDNSGKIVGGILLILLGLIGLLVLGFYLIWAIGSGSISGVMVVLLLLSLGVLIGGIYLVASA